MNEVTCANCGATRSDGKQQIRCWKCSSSEIVPNEKSDDSTTSEVRRERIGMTGEQETTITDIRIPFGRMVAIILKWMLASIPAILLMYLIMFAVALIFGVGLGGCAALLSQ